VPPLRFLGPPEFLASRLKAIAKVIKKPDRNPRDHRHPFGFGVPARRSEDMEAFRLPFVARAVSLVGVSSFSAMLDAPEANGARVVLVEDATRFARKVLAQELGIMELIARGVTCWAARGDLELTNTGDEFKIAMRQMAAAFSELEKTRLGKS